MPNQGLALDLTELEIEPLQPEQPVGAGLETIGYGHGMSELTASAGDGSCSASCCVACCCCCCS